MFRNLICRQVVHRYLFVLIAWALCWPADATGAPTNRSSFEFQPGVVIDPQRSTAYLMSPAGGIEAVDLDSGTVIWTSQAAAMPLAMHGEQLIAQVEEPGRVGGLTLAYLATRAGGRLIRTHDIELPGGVAASIDDDSRSRFLLRAVGRPDGLYLTWHYTLRKKSGKHPRAGKTSANRQRSGAFRFNPVSGIAQEAPIEKAKRRRAGDLPPGLASLVESGELPAARWFTKNDTGWALVERSGNVNGTRAVLRRWDAQRGNEQPPIVIFDDRDLRYRYPSADERHVLASRPLLSIDHRSERFEWAIFSLENGRKLTDVTLGTPAARFFIHGGLLILEGPPARIADGTAWLELPRRIRAVTLDRGDETWYRPLRDPRYRGTTAPGAQIAETGSPSTGAGASPLSEDNPPHDEQVGEEVGDD